MAKSTIASRINSLLAEKGISKQEFYNVCHISSATFSLWNTGKTTPRMKNLESIATFLHTTTEYLLTGLGEKETPSTAEGEGLNDAQQEALSYIKTLNDEQLRRFVAVLAAMRQLNAEGQERLVEYADDLTATGKYKKHDFNEVVLQKEA